MQYKIQKELLEWLRHLKWLILDRAQQNINRGIPWIYLRNFPMGADNRWTKKSK